MTQENSQHIKNTKPKTIKRRYVRINVIGRDTGDNFSLVRNLLGQNSSDVVVSDGVYSVNRFHIRKHDYEWIVGKGMLHIVILN